MPLYDFRCDDCGTLTEVRSSVDELDGLQPACTRCGGSALRRLLSTVSVMRSGGGPVPTAGGGGGCGHCAGGCACGA